MTSLKLFADPFYALKPRQMISPNRYIKKSPILAILSPFRVDF